MSRIAARSPGGAVRVFVEIPKGGHNKYEFDGELGVFRFDRALYSAVYYPAEYGFVPGTLAGDDERLDALVMTDQPTFPGCLIETRVLGAMAIETASGRREGKLLTVPVDEPRFAEHHDVRDIAKHQLREIEHFFDVFRELEERPVKSRGWVGADEGERLLEAAIRRWEESAGS